MRRDGCSEEDIEICGKVRANLKYRDHKRMKRQQQYDLLRARDAYPRFHPYSQAPAVPRTDSLKPSAPLAAPPSPFDTPSAPAPIQNQQSRLPAGL